MEKKSYRLGSIEAGGTKFVCAVGNEKYDILEVVQFPTTTPVETLDQVIDFFKEHQVDSIGIGSFGPIEIRQEHEHYGHITSTPKLAWQQTDILGEIQNRLGVPCYFTTDVNASAYGEKVSHPTPIDSLVYFTIGTGIGGGAIQDGTFIGGRSHGEMGHVTVKRHIEDQDYQGNCPFHQDCLEGLASGPTIEGRTGIRGEVLAETQKNHPVWGYLSYYIAQAAVNTTLNMAPEKIIFGGGVVSESLLKQIRTDFDKLLNGYVAVPPLNEYLVLPKVANNGSATIGNFALALENYKQ